MGPIAPKATNLLYSFNLIFNVVRRFIHSTGMARTFRGIALSRHYGNRGVLPASANQGGYYLASVSAFRLDSLQMLRGVAAAAVVVHHALEVSNGAASAFSPDFLTTAGAAGVDVFFVISGFIILYTSFPAGRSPLSPRTFMLRRMIRIYPMHWICLWGASRIQEGSK